METKDERGLDSLQVWQRAMALAVQICKCVIPLFPPDEKWGLSSQLRRSAQSIPANIAEGFGRYYYQETVRYCYLARGSLEETYTHLSMANQLGYLSDADYVGYQREVGNLRHLLNGYIVYLKRTKRGENEPGAVKPSNVREPSEDYSAGHTSTPGRIPVPLGCPYEI